MTTLITSMEEFIKAAEEGKEFEFFCNLDNVWKFGKKKNLALELSIGYVHRMIADKWVRIKPVTVTLHEYVSEDCPGSIWVGNFIQTIFVNGIHHQKTGRTITGEVNTQ